MIIKQLYAPKEIRFDINDGIKNIDSTDTQQETELYFLIGSSPSVGNILQMGYRIHVIRRSDNDELLGFRLEQGFSYDIESKEKDLITLTEMITLFYSTVKAHISENAKIKILEQPACADVASNTISELVSRGDYL
ncbi:hypothetical protein FA048_08230 [Pedobacter polaris]|uniref:Uncharacterized protein n=1 Tax=Pedobacter polaris TaxID=2571273 RepID=A0A4U1CT05_9SPHI|nr:hypothetical protein [Pedobacter polaris]TKC10175.1 hypothetical protein FA048_08230 [Pedobacter polaris]